MVNTGKTNVVGRIIEEEIFLLDYLQAWDKFGFILKNRENIKGKTTDFSSFSPLYIKEREEEL